MNRRLTYIDEPGAMDTLDDRAQMVDTCAGFHRNLRGTFDVHNGTTPPPRF